MSTQDADHVVMVTCDMANFRLRIETPSLTVQPGQSVVWCITGLPEGWRPLLSPTLGKVLPFESVTSTATTIWARGAKAEFKETTYRIHLQYGSSVEVWRGGGAVLFSQGAFLKSALPELEEVTPLVFHVSGVPDQGFTRLEVNPHRHTIHDGDTVEWRFDPSCFPAHVDPSRCLLQALFTQYAPDSGIEASPNLAFGPFEMITTTATTVVGSGNNEVKGIYSFQVVVDDETGNRISLSTSQDPSIDNRDGVDG